MIKAVIKPGQGAPKGRPIRVLHIITRMIIGGAQENTLLTVEGLEKFARYEATLATGPETGSEGEMLSRAAQTSRVVFIPSLGRAVNPLKDLSALWQLYRAIKRGRYHIVHTHSSKAGVLGRVAAKLAGTPLIVHTLHGPVFHDFQPWYTNFSWRVVKKLCASFTDQFISVSDALARGMSNAGIFRPDRCVTIYSGMELDWYLKAQVDQAAVRRSLGIAPDALVVGKIARLDHLKGHDHLISAAPEIVRRYPGIKFLLVGDGALRERLAQRVSDLNLTDSFVFAGLMPRERIPEMIAAMNVLVHTGLREGLARVLPQALAMGKPCIALTTDGSPEVVIPGETGFLVAPNDVTALTRSILKLLDDPSLREQMGAAGRRLVDPAFRAERMVEQIAGVYDRLVENYAQRIAKFDKSTHPNGIVGGGSRAMEYSLLDSKSMAAPGRFI